MKIGAMELIVIFIVALFVIGPDKLPSYARRFGNALREFRKASSDVTQDIRQSVVTSMARFMVVLGANVVALSPLKIPFSRT